MKHRKTLGGLLPTLLVLLVWTATVVAAPSPGKVEKTTLTIQGMTCGGCVATVKLRLKKTKGVLGYDVSLDKGEAEVTYDPAATNAEAIAASVSETGFKATVKARGNTDSRKEKHE